MEWMDSACSAFGIQMHVVYFIFQIFRCIGSGGVMQEVGWSASPLASVPAWSCAGCSASAPLRSSRSR